MIRAIIEDAKRAPSSMNSSRSDIVREVAQTPDDEAIMTCIAMGYPDEAFPANAVRSERQPADAFVRYVGFAED